MQSVKLKPKEDRRLLRGHLWAYRNEFATLPVLADGAVVDVASDGGRFVGRGFFQAQGGIAVRLLTRRAVEIDQAFIQERVAQAQAFRASFFPGETTYRWVFGESDGLPGLVADRYGNVVSAASSCAFYARHLDHLAAAFLGDPGVKGLRLEVAGTVHTFGDVPSRVECRLNGFDFEFDLGAGQKTGLFLDQRVNCGILDRLVTGRRVLDGHCYLGLWSCHAARAGAAEVLGVDTSAKAVEAAEANVRRNGLQSQCRFECADMGEVLERGDSYDVVLLDPPAFAKSRAHTHKALGLYHAINRAALKAVVPGGYLISSSCSHFVDTGDFLEMLKRAAIAAQREAWILEVRGAAPDHPVLMAMPETAYLKCVVLRVL